MTLPGFSAEASFYRGNGYYQPGVVLAGLRRQGEVIPQMYATCFPYLRVCCVYFDDGSTYCCLGLTGKCRDFPPGPIIIGPGIPPS